MPRVGVETAQQVVRDLQLRGCRCQSPPAGLWGRARGQPSRARSPGCWARRPALDGRPASSRPLPLQQPCPCPSRGGPASPFPTPPRCPASAEREGEALLPWSRNASPSIIRPSRQVSGSLDAPASAAHLFSCLPRCGRQQGLPSGHNGRTDWLWSHRYPGGRRDDRLRPTNGRRGSSKAHACTAGSTSPA